MSINCTIKMRFMSMYDKNHFNIFEDVKNYLNKIKIK